MRIHHAHQTTALKRCITSNTLTPRSLCNVTNGTAVLYSLVPGALSSVQRCQCASENVANSANDSIVAYNLDPPGRVIFFCTSIV